MRSSGSHPQLGIKAVFCTLDGPVLTEIRGLLTLCYWSYLYYLSKYYELLDTLLQLARGKPPPNFFLHVYHHALVLFMAWGWLQTSMSTQYVGLATNCAVHVIMYSYFLTRTITGREPWWKKFVTVFQIVQFAFSFFCVLGTLWIWWRGGRCQGMGALGWSAVFNATLFVSFVGVLKKHKKRRKGD